MGFVYNMRKSAKVLLFSDGEAFTTQSGVVSAASRSRLKTQNVTVHGGRAESEPGPSSAAALMENSMIFP